jgi:alpha-galactosidase
MRSKKLAGSELALVDINAETLAIVRRLADRLEPGVGSKLTITAPHTTRMLCRVPSSSFLPSRCRRVSAYGEMDQKIPLRHGVRQPYAENGGPGGFAHASRNIGPVLRIVHDMEGACPEAWFINYTNPMVRICDAIHRYSKIKVIGLCHQIFAGYGWWVIC